MVVNGEVYNHLALRAQLEAAGHTFATSSDCEVLLRLYLEHGPEFMQRVAVHGMYAFFMYDANTDTAVVVRRAGSCPAPPPSRPLTCAPIHRTR